jgi:hypothetical protein
MKNAPYPVDLSAMQTTLKEHRQSLGKETGRFHYSNEVGLINYAITGKHNGCVRELLITRKLVKAMRRVVCENTKLMKLHVCYDDRKQACRKLFLRITTSEIKN